MLEICFSDLSVLLVFLSRTIAGTKGPKSDDAGSWRCGKGETQLLWPHLAPINHDEHREWIRITSVDMPYILTSVRLKKPR